MALAGISDGMWVADIGAGEGYYTVRLARAVGAKGRVLAEDIVPETRDRLAMRVQRENLDNVAVRLGKPDDAMLPARSFDRILMVHMYHEVESPYALLWRVRDGLKPGGEIIVVDADRPASRHGMPPSLLACEFRAVGLDLIRIRSASPTANPISPRSGRPGPRPAPARDQGLQALEQVAEPPEAREAVPAGEDQMVEDRAVERFGGRGQPPRRPAVGVARPRVAARVVVGQHDAGAAVPRRHRR